ncbi:alpha/beta hydrolase [Marinobacter sp. M216]|uniref:Alpha/beta hydrolase n=1 Tax=Marinobacter albus TaxID=3030833 RepID=A0ABT7HCJ1_9GAMM|nr:MULTISPECIES: alpha/beta hydrolase [unclassified Marinobacter]MBW7469995.1 alpha/beta hydrolase [Marinobacter sp. F4218]MDK9557742.1 alpha/beta hydrolase [Marinobacter sp. M216]
MNDIAMSSEAIKSAAGFRESKWRLRSLSLAGLTWPARTRATEPKTVLMLHGWLDNSLSFIKLAPELTDLANVHAIDMAGHGQSGHRPEGQSYLLMDYVADLAEVVDGHFSGTGETQVDLVGHSLGGIVCALYAAAFPENVRKLVMIDSLGAISRPVEETVPQLRRAIKKRLAGSGRQTVYPDIQSAAKAREGGLSPLSPEAALTLIPRNMKPEGDGFVWRTDPRLRHPSPLMMSEDQVIASLKAIVTPTLFVRAEKGLLAFRKGLDERREVIASLDIANVPGGHHCHLDGDTRPVAEAIRNFLEDE